MNVEGDDGFGLRIKAGPQLSEAVGKARPRHRLAGLLVHDHDIHLRSIHEQAEGAAVEERAGMKR